MKMQAVTITQITYSELESLIKQSVDDSLSGAKVELANKPFQGKLIVTRDEVATFYGTTRQNIAKLTDVGTKAKGKLKSISVGSSYRYHVADVLEYFQAK